MARNSIPVSLSEDGFFIDKETNEVLDPQEFLKTSDLYITDASSKSVNQLATGVRIPTYRKKSWDYLKDINDFNETSENDIYKHMEVCDKLYRFEPIVGTALDMMVDFTLTQFNLISDNKELVNIFDDLKKDFNNFEASDKYLFAYPTGLNSFIRETALEWFISGNVFPYTEWKKKKIKTKVYKVPYKGVNLNPQSITIERLTTPLGASQITYWPEGAPRASSNQQDNGTTINLNRVGNSGVVNTNLNAIIDSKNASEVLDHKRLYHIKRNASGYKRWGQPYLTKIFTSMKSKNKLRYLDDATIDGLVNYIAIFKIGSTDVDSPYHKVPQGRITAFKSLIENPQASNMLVWPHDIDVITVGPDNKVLDFEKRYDVIDRDVMRSLGVPVALLDGTGGNVQVTWASTLSLIERMEVLRDSIANYLKYLMYRISQENELEYNKLKIVWSPTSLRDEQTIKNLLLAFYDRGLLPIETTLFYADYDPEEMITLKKKESKENLEQYFKRPDIPYSPNGQNNNFGRNPDQGRPKDNTSTDTPKSEVTTQASIITGKFKENMISQVNSLKEELIGIKKVDYKVDDRILAHFTKLKQISDVVIDVEAKTSNIHSYGELLKDFFNWKDNYLTDIQKTFSEELSENLSYIRKQEAADFILKGVFSDLNSKLETFCDKTLSVIHYVPLFSGKNISLSAKGDLIETNEKEVFENIPFYEDFTFKTWSDS